MTPKISNGIIKTWSLEWDGHNIAAFVSSTFFGSRGSSKHTRSFVLYLSPCEILFFIVFVAKEKVWDCHQRINQTLELPGRSCFIYMLSTVWAFVKAHCPPASSISHRFRKTTVCAKGMTAWNESQRVDENVQADRTIYFVRNFGGEFLVLWIFFFLDRHLWVFLLLNA